MSFPISENLKWENVSSGAAVQNQKKTRKEASFATLDAFIDCKVKGVRSLMTHWCDLLLLFYPSSQHSEEVFETRIQHASFAPMDATV